MVLLREESGSVGGRWAGTVLAEGSGGGDAGSPEGGARVPVPRGARPPPPRLVLFEALT